METDLHRLKQLLHGATERIEDDLVRARKVTGSAAAGLMTSFQGLRQELTQQSQELNGLNSLFNEATSGKGFSDTMGDVVKEFVDQLIRVSRDSLRIVASADVVTVDVRQVAREIQQIEKLSRATRMVALNARIEAGRSGQAGVAFQVVAMEVKDLADRVAGFSQTIVALVQRAGTGMEEMRATVEALASHDMSVALASQMKLSGALETLTKLNDATATALVKVSDHVDRAMEALQFEDMVNQLFESSSQKLKAFRVLLDGAIDAAFQAGAGSDTGAEIATLEHAAHQLAHSVVRQESVEHGGVELF